MRLRRHVSLPESREPPAECLRALRALHPLAEMVYAGNGMWWLGLVLPNTPARLEGDTIVATARARERMGGDVRVATWRKGTLMQQGFRLLASVGIQNGGADPSPSQCAQSLAPALYSTHREDEALLDARERVSDGSDLRAAQDARLQGDVLGYHARDVYRTYRRRSVTVHGSKATSSPTAPVIP